MNVITGKDRRRNTSAHRNTVKSNVRHNYDRMEKNKDICSSFQANHKPYSKEMIHSDERAGNRGDQAYAKE